MPRPVHERTHSIRARYAYVGGFRRPVLVGRHALLVAERVRQRTPPLWRPLSRGCGRARFSRQAGPPGAFALKHEAICAVTFGEHVAANAKLSRGAVGGFSDSRAEIASPARAIDDQRDACRGQGHFLKHVSALQLGYLAHKMPDRGLYDSRTTCR